MVFRFFLIYMFFFTFSFCDVVLDGIVLAKNQQLNRGIGQIETLDPQMVTGVFGGLVLSDMFEGLFTYNSDGDLIYGQAKSSSVSKDGLVYIFKIREDAKWSNGDKVTAGDFVYAFKRGVSPELASPFSWYFEAASIKNATQIINGKKKPDDLGVKALDDNTLQIILESPLPYYLEEMLAHTTFYPVSQKVVEKLGKKWLDPKNMVSNGPFMLISYDVNDRLVVKKNPKYYNSDKIILDEVVYHTITLNEASYNRYRSGDIDVTAVGAVPSDYLPIIKKSMPSELKNLPYFSIEYYDFNLKKKPFDDVRVRKALSYAVDRDVLTKYVIASGATPAYTFLNAKLFKGYPNIPPKYATWTQEQRNKEAKRLLEDAGYTKDKPLEVTISYNTLESHKRVAVAIASMWKQALGVKTELYNQEWKTFLSTRREGDFEIARDGWVGDYFEPSAMLNVMIGTNIQNSSKFVSKKYDSFMEESKSIQDPIKRYKVYNKADNILIEQMPIIPLSYGVAIALVKPYIGGYPSNYPSGNIPSKFLYIKKH